MILLSYLVVLGLGVCGGFALGTILNRPKAELPQEPSDEDLDRWILTLAQESQPSTEEYERMALDARNLARHLEQLKQLDRES